MNPDSLKFADITDMAVGNMIGNAMSVNVIARIIVNVLDAARLRHKNGILKPVIRDRWMNGQAAQELIDATLYYGKRKPPGNKVITIPVRVVQPPTTEQKPMDPGSSSK